MTLWALVLCFVVSSLVCLPHPNKKVSLHTEARDTERPFSRVENPTTPLAREPTQLAAPGPQPTSVMRLKVKVKGVVLLIPVDTQR